MPRPGQKRQPKKRAETGERPAIQAKTGRRYFGRRYWEDEKPVEASTPRIALAYFPDSGKFQIASVFRDKTTGESRRGRVVVLDQEDLQLHPDALGLLRQVLDEWTAPTVGHSSPPNTGEAVAEEISIEEF